MQELTAFSAMGLWTTFFMRGYSMFKGILGLLLEFLIPSLLCLIYIFWLFPGKKYILFFLFLKKDHHNQTHKDFVRCYWSAFPMERYFLSRKRNFTKSNSFQKVARQGRLFDISMERIVGLSQHRLFKSRLVCAIPVNTKTSLARLFSSLTR